MTRPVATLPDTWTTAVEQRVNMTNQLVKLGLPCRSPPEQQHHCCVCTQVEHAVAPYHWI